MCDIKNVDYLYVASVTFVWTHTKSTCDLNRFECGQLCSVSNTSPIHVLVLTFTKVLQECCNTVLPPKVEATPWERWRNVFAAERGRLNSSVWNYGSSRKKFDCNINLNINSISHTTPNVATYKKKLKAHSNTVSNTTNCICSQCKTFAQKQKKYFTKSWAHFPLFSFFSLMFDVTPCIQSPATLITAQLFISLSIHLPEFWTWVRAYQESLGSLRQSCCSILQSQRRNPPPQSHTSGQCRPRSVLPLLFPYSKASAWNESKTRHSFSQCSSMWYKRRIWLAAITLPTKHTPSNF